MLKFILNGAVIQLLTLLLEYYVIYSSKDEVQFNGAGGIWFCLLTKYCFFNGAAKIKFCCFNWKFNRKIYPFVLLAVCTLINFGIPYDMMIGLLYGLLQVYLEKITIFPAAITTRIGLLINIPSI